MSLGPCDPSVQAITLPPKCQEPPLSENPHNPRAESPGRRLNTPRLDTLPHSILYCPHNTQRREIMSVAYHQAQKQRYRITLEMNVLADFDPHQIDWEKLFKLEPSERCEAYVEDLDCPSKW